MGEAKRKRERLTPAERAGVELTHKLVNEGRLIEGGFAAYLMGRGIDVRTCPPEIMIEWRDAYMSGAEHLWTSIMATLDPGKEETPADLRRFDSIQREMDVWRKTKMDAMAQAAPTMGSA